jgi:hypothetical protein
VAQRARCRRTVAVAEIVSEIAAFHRAQGSVRIATLLVAAGLEATPLDRPVLAEVPAWEAVDSATAVAAAAGAVAAEVVAVAEVVGAEGKQTI